VNRTTGNAELQRQAVDDDRDRLAVLTVGHIGLQQKAHLGGQIAARAHRIPGQLGQHRRQLQVGRRGEPTGPSGLVGARVHAQRAWST